MYWGPSWVSINVNNQHKLGLSTTSICSTTQKMTSRLKAG
jgi:hypothetical protein